MTERYKGVKPFKSYFKPEKAEKKIKQPLARTSIKKKPFKPSGELEVFKEIWEERPRICQVTGDPIHAFDPWCFMHILAKGPYPKFKLRKENIYLVAKYVHTEYDDGDRSHEMFDEVNKLKDKLKAEYYGGQNG